MQMDAGGALKACRLRLSSVFSGSKEKIRRV
jgi:hypothetical protein